MCASSILAGGACAAYLPGRGARGTRHVRDYEPVWIDNQTVLVSRLGGSSFKLLRVPIDAPQRHRTLLRDGPRIDAAVSPTISPDGTMIAFIAQIGTTRRRLFLMKANGRDLRQISSAPRGVLRGPVFSPDGRSHVYVQSPGHLLTSTAAKLRSGAKLVLLNIGTHRRRTLLQLRSGGIRTPSWR